MESEILPLLSLEVPDVETVSTFQPKMAIAQIITAKIINKVLLFIIHLHSIFYKLDNINHHHKSSRFFVVIGCMMRNMAM